MKRLSAIFSGQAFTVALIVCVSVCCCQARFLALAMTADDQCGQEISATATTLCCAGNAANADRTDDSGDRSTPVPCDGCTSCCIKAVNPYNGSVELPALVETGEVTHTAWHEPATLSPQVADLPDSATRLPPGVAPPTLLSQCCALII